MSLYTYAEKTIYVFYEIRDVWNQIPIPRISDWLEYKKYK
jgi:hypothetical protein